MKQLIPYALRVVINGQVLLKQIKLGLFILLLSCL